MNLTSIIACAVIAAVVIGIIARMIKNVKKGKSFCGAELSEPLNTNDIAQLRKKQKSIDQ